MIENNRSTPSCSPRCSADPRNFPPSHTAPEIKNTFFTRLGFSLDHEAGFDRPMKKVGVVRLSYSKLGTQSHRPPRRCSDNRNSTLPMGIYLPRTFDLFEKKQVFLSSAP